MKMKDVFGKNREVVFFNLQPKEKEAISFAVRNHDSLQERLDIAIKALCYIKDVINTNNFTSDDNGNESVRCDLARDKAINALSQIERKDYDTLYTHRTYNDCVFSCVCVWL